jgi:hypothetical protein
MFKIENRVIDNVQNCDSYDKSLPDIDFEESDWSSTVIWIFN